MLIKLKEIMIGIIDNINFLYFVENLEQIKMIKLYLMDQKEYVVF